MRRSRNCQAAFHLAVFALLFMLAVLRPIAACAGAGNDLPPERKNKGLHTGANATSLHHVKRDHVPAREKSYQGLFCMDGIRHPGDDPSNSTAKNLDVLKKDLELTARKAILREILYAHFKEQGLIQPTPLLRDESVAPYLQTLKLNGMHYFNGDNFGEICLKCTGRLSARDRRLLEETTVAVQGFCQPGNATLVKDLRSNATLDFMHQTLGKYNPKLFAASPGEAAMLSGELWLTNQTVNLDNLNYCMDAVARLVPYFATYYVVPKKDPFKPKKPVVVSKQVWSLDLTNGTEGDPRPDLGQGLVLENTPQGRAIGLNASYASTMTISATTTSEQDLKGFNATVQADWPIHFPQKGQDPVRLEVVTISWSNGVRNFLTIELPGPQPMAVLHYGRQGISYPMPWNDTLNRVTFIKTGDLLRIRCNGKPAITLKAGGDALGSITLNMPEGTTIHDLVLSRRYIDYE